MITLTRKMLAATVPLLALICLETASGAGQEPTWTIVLHPKDFVIGVALGGLHTRHTWVDHFDDKTGSFDVAVSKTAVAIPAPQCRMNYLILQIPFYYPENPKQASVSERRAIYDSLVALQNGGSGRVSIRVEAPLGLARASGRRIELVACNLYFALPLSVQFSTRQ